MIGQTDVDEAVEQWRTEGWVLIDGLVPADDVAPALAEARALDRDAPAPGPTRRPDEHAAAASEEPRFRGAQFSGTTLFPVADAPHLNRLFVHPAVVDFARRALADDDLRIYQSRLWSKFGDRTDYEQPLHRDQNHSLVPTRSDPGFWFMECFLYLCDVDEANGAPGLVSRTDAVAAGEPSERGPVGSDEAAPLYNAERTASGSAGSLLAYRSDVWHRGRDLAPGTERHVLVLAFKPAGLDWVGFDAHPPLVNSADFIRFAEACTPDELSLFGVPRPGHPYWTPKTVEAMAAVCPGLDLSPWRQAL